MHYCHIVTIQTMFTLHKYIFNASNKCTALIVQLSAYKNGCNLYKLMGKKRINKTSKALQNVSI